MSQTAKNIRTLFILYELGQVSELENFWSRQPEERAESLVIALSLDIETELTRRGIHFFSGRNYKQIIPDQLTIEDKIISSFFTDRRWEKFIYRGVNLVTVFQFMFRTYFQRIWYYGNLLINIVKAHPTITRWVLFKPSEIITDTFGGLAKREINVVIDCSKVIAAASNISVDIKFLTLSPANVRHYTQPLIFRVKRALFGFMLSLWNLAIIYWRCPQQPRLIISDYWKNVGSVIESLPNAECIFLDRGEIRYIGWRALWRYRMRFVHVTNFLSRRLRQRAQQEAQKLSTVWQEMRDNLAPVFTHHDYSFDVLLRNAIDDLVGNFEKILCEIEGTYALYDKLSPDMILLRASVSGQTHFSILPLVARQCDIPSLELQHGLEYLGPGSWSREHTAEYLAVYGPLIKKELVAIGYSSEKILEIGSPRFDNHSLGYWENNYQNDDHKGKQFTVLCIAPDIRPFEIYDSYSAEDYFTAIARAVEPFKGINLIIKLRSVSANEVMLRTMIERIFVQVPHTTAQYEPLGDLYLKADLVVSGYSTIVLEALRFGLPVIMPALNPVEEGVINFHFSKYIDAGLYITPTDKEMAGIITQFITNPKTLDTARQRARSFIARNFSFDNNSAQRCANLITQIISR